MSDTNGAPPPTTTTATTPAATPAPSAAPQKTAPAATPATSSAPTATPVSDGTVQDLLDLQSYGEKYVELTIDGQPERMKVSEALALVRKAKASDKRFNEASALSKKAQEAQKQYEARISQVENLDRLLSDPNTAPEVLKKILGPRWREIALQEAERHRQWEALPQEQRDRLQLEEERQQFRQEQQRIAQERERLQREHQERQLAQQAAQMRPAIEQAFQEEIQRVGLANSKLSRIASKNLISAAKDYLASGRPLTRQVVAALADKVKAEIDEVYGETKELAAKDFAGLEGPALIAKLEELGALEKVRQADAQRLQTPLDGKSREQPRGEDGKFLPKTNGTAPKKSLEQMMAERGRSFY